MAAAAAPSAGAPLDLGGASLQELALRVLATPLAHDKAALTLAIAAAWQAGTVPLLPAAGTPLLPVPASPARPPSVLHVHPTKVKSGSKKHTVHALCHAESYAIDLTMDLIARFGFAPATWAPAGPDCCAGSAHLPVEFFDAWVRVAGEEAVHFSRWAARLAELGAAYGDFPAHGSLWESAEDTAHSLAARLAVVHCVHEGRGLDVAGALRAKLSAGGDDASAAILSANLAEEVTHVAEGVRWLRQLAEWGGLASPVPLFQALVRKHFHGALRPPFAVAERARAGMGEEWYLPLCAPAPGGGAPEATAGTVELTAEDMG
jgi:uncharacterized ferritin-like protein (DUF455 family)